MEKDSSLQTLDRTFFPKIQVFSGNIETLPNESKRNKFSLATSKTFKLNDVPIVYNFSAQMELQNGDYINVVCLRNWFGGKLNAIAVHNTSTNACYYEQATILGVGIFFCIPLFFIFGALFLLSLYTAPIALLFWGAIPVSVWGWLNAVRAKKIVLEFQKKQKKQIVP